MGLCASQARLLMLTARSSDIEFEIQQISQARMVLAQNEESVEKKYAEATANKKIQIRTDDNKTINLTPTSLIEAGYGFKFNGKEYTSLDDIEEIKEVFGSSINKTGTDDNVFQRYLSEGRITLLEPKDKTSEDDETEFIEISMSGAADIYEVFYTEDDAAAKAEHDSALSKLQHKDKQLELDQDRLETEHNAIQTEIESVEGIIQKNIESSYKVFAES